jgi:hypothetical protein
MIEVLNVMGQRVQSYRTSGQPAVELDVQVLPDGMYIMAAYDKRGVLLANGRFVKE